MKKLLLISFLFMLSISFVSAVTLYSGESTTIELEKSYEYYSIVGNESEVILNITQDGNNVTIIPDKYMKSDSFEVIFFDSEKETITVYSSSSSGSSTRTVYKDRNVTEYRDVDRVVYKDKIIQGEEVEKIVRKTSVVAWIFLIVLLLYATYITLSGAKRRIAPEPTQTDERGLEKDE